MKKKKIEIILGIIIILGIFLLKLNILNEPYYYMEMRNMNWALKQMDEFNLSYDKIHPPGQEIIFAMSWNVLGYSIVSSHSLNIFLGIIGLAYLYLLGKHIVNSRVGLGAVILLIFNQIFFTNLGISEEFMLLTTLGIITVYYYLKKKNILFTIFATTMLMTRETSALIILSIGIHYLLIRLQKNKKIRFKDIKSCWFIFVPILPLLAIAIAQLTNVGLVFRADRFLLKTEFVQPFIMFIFTHLFHDSSIANVNKFNFIIFVCIIVSQIMLIRSKISEKKPGLHFLFWLILILHMALFSYVAPQPKRILPVLPFFYMLGAYSIYILTLKFKYKKIIYAIFIFFCVLLFTTNYAGTRITKPEELQSNMDYLDEIHIQKEAIRYLETKFSNETIMAIWPMYDKMVHMEYGYITKRLEVYDDRHLSIFYEGLFIHLPRARWSNWLKEILEKDDLELVHKFEKNGKVIEIYNYSRR